MGIKDLLKFVRQKTNGYYTCSVEEFRCRKLGIDGNLLLFRFLTTSESVADMALKLINYFKSLEDNGFELIVVFDNPIKHRPEKTMTSAKRVDDRKKRKELYEQRKKELDIEIELMTEDIFNIDDKKIKLEKLRRQTQSITVKEFYQIFALVSSRFNVLIADNEADPTLVYLFRLGAIDAVMSCDSDFLAYGVTVMISEIKYGRVCYYDLDTIIPDLDISFEEFTMMCVLSGSDFSTRIPGFGIMRTYNLISSGGLTDKHCSLCGGFDFTYGLFHDTEFTGSKNKSYNECFINLPVSVCDKVCAAYGLTNNASD